MGQRQLLRGGQRQDTARDVARAADVIGTAPAAATVLLNLTNSPYRHSEYFWSTVGTNHLAAAWLPVTVTASQGATNQTNAGHLFLPTSPETFTHDRDGNLTSADRWTNTWDAENRLLTMQTRAPAYNAGAPHQNMVFTSDWQGRRISKTVRTWTSGH